MDEQFKVCTRSLNRIWSKIEKKNAGTGHVFIGGCILKASLCIYEGLMNIAKEIKNLKSPKGK